MTGTASATTNATTVAFIMDPPGSFNPKKDTTLDMIRACAMKGCRILYVRPNDLSWTTGTTTSREHDDIVARELSFLAGDAPYPTDWFSLSAPLPVLLSDIDIAFMRQDPPFNMEYIYATYLLDHWEAAGVTVVNPPRTLRNFNEKCAIMNFPVLISPTLITRVEADVRAFVEDHGKSVIKPLDGMGGESIFLLDQADQNLSVILETMLRDASVMVQRYIPEIKRGDKRIILIDGEAVPHALARIPKDGELRGNLAAGGSATIVPLSDNDRRICESVGPWLKSHGILLAGIDVIGDYLTEINITSPTGFQEISRASGIDIATRLVSAALGKRPT